VSYSSSVEGGAVTFAVAPAPSGRPGLRLALVQVVTKPDILNPKP